MGLLKKKIGKIRGFIAACGRLPVVLRKIDFLLDLERYRQQRIEIPCVAAWIWGRMSRLEEVKLADLRLYERTEDGGLVVVSLSEFCLSRFLRTRNDDDWNHYLQQHARRRQVLDPTYKPTKESWLDFARRIGEEGYDPSQMCIVINDDRIIVDGQHRCCALLSALGPDSLVKVVRIIG